VLQVTYEAGKRLRLIAVRYPRGPRSVGMRLDDFDFVACIGKVRLSILPSPYLFPQLGPSQKPYLNLAACA